MSLETPHNSSTTQENCVDFNKIAEARLRITFAQTATALTTSPSAIIIDYRLLQNLQAPPKYSTSTRQEDITNSPDFFCNLPTATHLAILALGAAIVYRLEKSKQNLI
jgi:hypothetical protein